MYKTHILQGPKLDRHQFGPLGLVLSGPAGLRREGQFLDLRRICTRPTGRKAKMLSKM